MRARRKASSAPKSASAGDDARFEAVLAAFAADATLRHVASAFAAEQAIGRPRKFGSGALKVRGKIFAMVVDGRLVVKLPPTRVSDMIRSGDGAPFDPGHGRVMKQWVVIINKRTSWISLAKEAHDFVRGIRN